MQMQEAQTDHSPTSFSAVDPVLLRVPPEHMSVIAPKVLPMIEAVADRSDGRWTTRALLLAIYEGRWDLWVVWDGEQIRMIVGTEVYEELSGKRFLGIRFATGSGAKQFAHMIDKLEAYASDRGCAAVDGWMRKGWARHLPEYRLSHILLEKDI